MKLFKLFSFCFSLLVFSTSLLGQKEILIKFTPDDFPQDITWELQNQDCKTIVAEGDLMGCLPSEECVVYQDNIEDKCYTLLIRDKLGDGLAMGGYEVFFGDELMVEGREFGNSIYHDFNCGPGEVCGQAIVLDLPDNKIYAPDTKEFWFSFTPEEEGHYRINTCDNRVTGTGVADTRMWYYDSCDRASHNCGADGALSYSDDNFVNDCEPGSGFDFIPLDAGVTYYIRHKPMQDWINIPKNDSLKIKVQKLPTRAGCLDPSACNYDPFAQIDPNNVCLYDTECAPDLSLDVEELIASIEVDTVFNNDFCLVEEGCLRGPGQREVIRFSTKIDNIGDADYVVGRPDTSPDLFSNDNCHGHAHHLGYAEYLMYKGEGQPEPIGFKSGFCVLDLDCTDAAPGTLPKYICANMGVTVGCSDIYEAALDCQWIDITDQPDGEYSLVVRINQFKLADARGLQEKTFDNNVGRVCLDIDRSSGKLVVTVLEDCPVYTDCFGYENGDAEFDCKGECGGLAHFGDLDNSGDIEEADLSNYQDLLINDGESTTCNDTYEDGVLTVFDAALIFDCLREKEAEANNPFHDHCTLPAGNVNPDEMAAIRVSDFSQTEGYIELEAWVSDRDLSAYQINTSGIRITEVEKLYAATPDFLVTNDSKVFALHGTEGFPRSTGFQPFIRIKFSQVTADSICIMSDSEMINGLYDRINLQIEGDCQRVSATDNFTPSSILSLLPNPAKESIKVNADNKIITAFEIYNVKGQRLLQKNVESVIDLDIPLNEISKGLYIIKVRTIDGLMSSKKFMKI